MGATEGLATPSIRLRPSCWRTSANRWYPEMGGDWLLQQKKQNFECFNFGEEAAKKMVVEGLLRMDSLQFLLLLFFWKSRRRSSAKKQKGEADVKKNWIMDKKEAEEHGGTLKIHQEKDPGFYEFLKEHDKELLEFDEDLDVI